MNLTYLVPRLVRHFLPDALTRFLLRRSLIIRPGLETNDSESAVARYLSTLAFRNETISDKRILVFGYGGRFDTGVGLLEAGAGYVVLCDAYAETDEKHNLLLAHAYSQYLEVRDGRAQPREDRLGVLRADIREVQAYPDMPPFDLVLSTSVFEHLVDVEGTTRALAALTLPTGLNIHYVDLRDHFFKYPFEMLHYSDAVWRRWLNPTSNHNRFRLRDYERVFHKYFGNVRIEILERDEAGFNRAKSRVRPEFASGDVGHDSVTLIKVVAAEPRPTVPP